jgi:hypothetical protein
MSDYLTIAEIKAANKAAGDYFFEPDTLKFFRSVVHPVVYGGTYFVTSEQAPYDSRRWTVRAADPDGSISTVGDFQEYRNPKDAISAAEALVAGRL